MKLTDEHKNRDNLIDGVLKVDKLVNGSWVTHHEEQFNLVVSLASYILRDLMFDGAERIDSIHFGDMGLDPAVDNVRDVDSPLLGDIALANKLYEKPVTKSVTDYGGHPAIEYVAILDKTEFNGSGEQLITEFALATSADRIFTRKTRAAIYKDNETTFRFTWFLVFNAG